MKIVHNLCLPYIFHVCRNGTSSFKFLNIKAKEMPSTIFANTALDDVLMSSACKLQLLSSPNPKQFEIHSLHVKFLELKVKYGVILFVLQCYCNILNSRLEVVY